MKTELEQKDIEVLAHRVAELLLPMIDQREVKTVQESLMDVQGIAEYLKVSKKWIYERVHFNEMPFLKIGGNIRFKREAIDHWLDSHEVQAVSRLDVRTGRSATLLR